MPIEESLRSELIEHAVRETRSRVAQRDLGAAETEGAARFARQCLEALSAEDLGSRSPGELAAAITSLWSHGRERPARTDRVRLVPAGPDSGWLEIVQDDMPFLLDSVRAALERRGVSIIRLIHPVVTVRRDAAGHRDGLAESTESTERGGLRESYMQVEIEGSPVAGLSDEIHAVLVDVRAAVEDFEPMGERLAQVIAESRELPPPTTSADTEVDWPEERVFLEWLGKENFVFLGACRLDLHREDGRELLRPVADSALGVFRVRRDDGELGDQPMTEKMSEFAHRPQILFVTKVRKRATVHRLSQMDYVGVRRWNAAGELVGEHRFYGLFTTVAFKGPVSEVPLVRHKVEWVRDHAGFDRKSHDGKALVDILETFPRVELFQFRRRELLEACLAVLRLENRRDVGLVVRHDPFGRFVSCLVYVPRDRYSDSQLDRIRPIVERAYAGQVADEAVRLSESTHAQIHLLVKRHDKTEEAIPERAAVEADLAEAVRTWGDRLRRRLLADPPAGLGPGAARRYAEAFPAAYREATALDQVLADLVKLEAAANTGRLTTRLFRLPEDPKNHVHFKVFHPGEAVPLSAILPLLDNLALWVATELPYEVRPANGTVVFIHDFTLVRRTGRPFDLEALAETFPAAFDQIWSRETENDGFNRLVTRAVLTWREVVILRAYARYLRQAATASQAAMYRTLSAHPPLARKLVELFAAKFDPDRPAGSDERAASLVAEIEQALVSQEEKVTPDEQRIFDVYLDAFNATLRTNFYQRDEDDRPKSYLSFKLDAGKLPFLAPPRQLFEVFVYSTRMEGIHLRGGKVARGGIRWSDRRDDFRTEVLGLVKTQKVKNSVIVPVGSKGGFVLKNPPPATDREAFQAEGIECYKLLIRGLLDLTDNRVGDEVLPPSRVVRYDEDDPYLVVAADKGTATFSNIANALSLEYGFWLGDAFASGGGAGYDHKGMGITARGAWEAVERHFRELDPAKDIQTEDFTVAGVGDMSGDVFGNGMLLSPHIRLIAAFDHRHIFVDPDPDAASTFVERRRLFDLGRSSWADYDRERLSPGGGIWPRTVGSIDLSPQAAAALDLKKTPVTPDELMRAILRAEVELLFLGGIGTYVKASDEPHAAANDRTNDNLRLDATDLRARVVGEGANLGFTQRARIELALRGGKINTDAIDNSAGVDTSDHEVNIKILFAPVVGRGALTTEARNQRLAAMTDAVAELVLADNYLQTQALSVAELGGAGGLDDQARQLRRLEREGKIDRVLEGLPDEAELAERQAKRQGLTRPELAVLLAYSKISLYDELVHSRLVDEPFFEQDLFAYFPAPLGADFAADIRGHRLRGEIIATVVTNELVNRVGPTFVSELSEATGRGADDIAAAYAVARDAFDLRALWRQIEALDNRVSARAQGEMLRATVALAERVALALLRAEPRIDAGALVAALGPVADRLSAELAGDEPKRTVRAILRAGAPEELARRIARLQSLVAAVDVWRLTRTDGMAVGVVAPVYFAVGAKFHFDGLRGGAERLGTGGRWPKAAADGLIEAFDHHQADITRQVLGHSATASSPERAIKAWTATRPAETRRTLELLREVDPEDETLVELAQLSVVEGALRRLAAG